MTWAATLAAITAGCSSHSTSLSHEPYVKPGLIMVTPDQASRYGLDMKPAETATTPPPGEPRGTSAVLQPEIVKVYPVARAADANDADLLHETHIVYRRETAARWRLDAPASQQILVGPRVTDGRQNLQPLLDKELTSFLSDQRRATEANQKAIASLFQAVESLNRQQQTLLERELSRTSGGETRPKSPGTTAGEDEAGSR